MRKLIALFTALTVVATMGASASFASSKADIDVPYLYLHTKEVVTHPAEPIQDDMSTAKQEVKSMMPKVIGKTAAKKNIKINGKKYTFSMKENMGSYKVTRERASDEYASSNTCKTYITDKVNPSRVSHTFDCSEPKISGFKLKKKTHSVVRKGISGIIEEKKVDDKDTVINERCSYTKVGKPVISVNKSKKTIKVVYSVPYDTYETVVEQKDGVCKTDKGTKVCKIKKYVLVYTKK